MESITNEKLEEWKKIQNEMAKKINEKDRIEVDKIKYILSIYLFICSDDETKGAVSYVITDYKDGLYGNTVKSHTIEVENTIPYMTGFLGFREVIFYKQAYDHACENFCKPDIIVINSFGKFHDRMAGSALHLALDLDMPVIGIGRSVICFDGLSDNLIRKQFKKECKESGDFLYIKGQTGTLYGAAVKTSNESKNPLYVSVGSYISLDTCVEIIVNISKHRFPEPMRKAETLAKNLIYILRENAKDQVDIKDDIK